MRRAWLPLPVFASIFILCELPFVACPRFCILRGGLGLSADWVEGLGRSGRWFWIFGVRWAWIGARGRGCPCDCVGFHAAWTVALGSEGSLQGQEAQQVGVPRVCDQMEGLVASWFPRAQSMGIGRFTQTTRYVFDWHWDFVSVLGFKFGFLFCFCYGLGYLFLYYNSYV